MPKKPWEAMLSGENFRLFPDNTSLEEYKKKHIRTSRTLGTFTVALCRSNPDHDYIRTIVEDAQIITFGQSELATWLAGVGVDDERQRVLKLAERANGSFSALVDGWGPIVIIKDELTDKEKEWFVEAEQSEIDEEWEHFNG